MGCWNETCMLTDLPIYEGETVGAVLLIKKNNMGKTYYPNDMWEPISPIIYGTYNGYGEITDIDLDTQRQILDIFRFAEQNNRAKFVTRQDELPEKPYHLFLESDTTLNEILGMAKDDGLYLQIRKFSDKLEWNTYQVSIAFLKQGFIERCADLKDSIIVSDHIHQLQQNIRDKISSLSEVENTLQDNESKKLIHQLKISITDSESARIGTFSPRNLMIMCFLQTQNIEEVFQVQMMLSKLRRCWMPTSGSGSQNGIDDKEVVEWYKTIVFYATNDYTSKSNP